MSTEKIVSAISSLSGFDMLDGVRSHNLVDDAMAEVRYALAMPSQDAVLAFESALHTSQYVVPVPPSQDANVTDVLAMADEISLTQDGVATDAAVQLPSPDTLLAEGVRQLQTGLGDVVGDAPVLKDSILEIPRTFTPLTDTSALDSSWIEAMPKAEVDAFQRGIENLDSLLHSVSSEILSQKDLLQLQFAMEEISVFKEIGIQISQKSASNIETVLKQSE